MSEPFVGQIILFAGNYAPAGWALCDGSLLPIAEYEVLFNAIGTTYGGDGRGTFALPDLRSRVPIGEGQGRGSNYSLGQAVGAEAATLTGQQIPVHSHPALAAEQAGNANVPAGNALLAPLGGQAASEYQLVAYGPASDIVELNANSVGAIGGGQPHSNVQPFGTINYCISLYGGGLALPYIGQIVLFGFNFAPQGWAQCNGQLLPLSPNIPLFSTIGTYYGGDGKSTFALPDLQDRAAVGSGQGPGLSSYDFGTTGGEPAVRLASNELPHHAHGFMASSSQATSADPSNNLLAHAWRALDKTDAAASFYSAKPDHATTPLAAGAIAPSGGNQPHNNMQPFLALTFCIALQGSYAQRR
jgi:microcystin-dependent protein